MTTIATVTKSTDQLVPGDIVLNHGMRLLLGEKHVSNAHSTSGPRADALRAAGHPVETFWFVGTVLNVEEVNADGVIPFSWRCETRPQYEGTEQWSDKGDKWTVQGNAWATWTVEAGK